ncbi:MAG: M23 family metallopeptidase [Bacteroidetes bacterium]|nr:M23 family metallopeptidase [Bacteroidota bacterium]MDA0879038.1 M23 family metallopeptidase [Bacteroidota bacterium]MDA1116133.1 M23 family metallopeptidase [Bacteroidota bacterium]
MAKKLVKGWRLPEKWLNNYILQFVNADTFEEKFSLRLTRLNVFVWASLCAIVLIFLTTILIAFTPIREYIPGYSSQELERRASELYFKSDSLQQLVGYQTEYIANIQKVLTGDLKFEQADPDNTSADVSGLSAGDLAPSQADSMLRETVRKEDKYNLFLSAKSGSNFVLFPPAQGPISADFNLKEKHFAVDVNVPINTPIKAAADGRVILTEWSVETGYVVLVEHSNNLLTVYKHNTKLTKSQGDIVKAGEVIAISGNTGILTTGPHLHFELWNNGYPVDPKTFIDFQQLR